MFNDLYDCSEDEDFADKEGSVDKKDFVDNEDFVDKGFAENEDSAVTTVSPQVRLSSTNSLRMTFFFNEDVADKEDVCN